MTERPKRKNIRLKDYDYSRNGAYFVTICVKDKHEMLGKVIVGRDVFIAPFVQLSKYGRIVSKHIERINSLHNVVTVIKHVVMPNHIHLILAVTQERLNGNGAMKTSRPTDAAIPKIIRSFKAMVTKEIGFSLWQTSYYDHIIRNEEEYKQIWRYIDENPLR